MEKKRENWMDAVKTIAIFIVLVNHAGVRIPGVNFWGGMFYVPVFFVLAGYTYRVKATGFAEFVKSKAKRLLVPYFTANLVFLLFFCAKELIIDGGLHTVNGSSLLGIFYARNQLFCMAEETPLMITDVRVDGDNLYFMTLQNAPTWFLPALFLSLVIFDGLMRLLKGNMKKTGLAEVFLLTAGIFYHYFSPYLLPWSIDAVPFFLVLIQAGCLAREKQVLKRVEQNKGWCLSAAVLTCLFIGAAVFNGSVNLSVGEYGRSVILALYNSLVSSLLVMLFCHASEYCFSKAYLPGWLVKPGRVTLRILCYHLFIFMFLGAGITMGCLMLGLDSNPYVIGFLKLLMIIFTIALFTRPENRKEERAA